MSLVRTALLFFDSLAIRIRLTDRTRLAAVVAAIRHVEPHKESAIDTYLLINVK